MRKKENYVIYLLTLLSLLLASYLWNKISLPYANPEEIIGYYSFFKYNQFNDTIRYIIFITIPLATFFFLFISLKKYECISFKKVFSNSAIKIPKRNFFLNSIFFLFIFILGIKFLSADFPNFTLDVFHEGQLLSGAYNFHITKELWKSTYVISGLFMDILNANLSWFFAGEESIGAYRFYIFFLQLLTSIAFLILSYYISKAFNYEKDEETVLFLILATVSLSLINTSAIVFRDLPLALLLIFCLIILKSYNKNQIVCLVLGFLTIISLLWSLDRGVYFNAALICFIIILYIKRKNSQIAFILSGALLGWLLFYFIIGKEEFSAFINHSFTVLKYMDLQHGVIHPTPFSDEPNASRATKNLLIIIANGIFIVSALLNRQNKIPRETKLFLVILFILALLFYKSGLSRSDGSHLKQAFSFHIILFSLFIYFYLLEFYKKNLNNKKFKFLLEKYLILLLAVIFILQNNINFYNLRYVVNFKERYINFINLDNNYFLINDDRQVVDRLKSLTKNENCFQLFNYHTAFTYLIEKKSCTKFSHIFNLGPKNHQFDFIDEIKQANPKYILYEREDDIEKIENNSKKTNFTRYSFIRPSVKFPYINKYILENYILLEKINNWIILYKPNT